MIVIHTDGSHCTFTKLGAWAYYNVTLDKLKTGHTKNTTSARMEIIAIIKALESVKHHKVDILIYTDVKLLEQQINDKFAGCIRNGWMTNNKEKPCANNDLLKELHLLITDKNYKVKAKWIKGHSEKTTETERNHDKVDRAAYYLLQKLRYQYKSYLKPSKE
jgi:ribonuclease HI